MFAEFVEDCEKLQISGKSSPMVTEPLKITELPGRLSHLPEGGRTFQTPQNVPEARKFSQKIGEHFGCLQNFPEDGRTSQKLVEFYEILGISVMHFC